MPQFQLQISNFALILILLCFLFFAVVPPIFCALGIYRLINKRHRHSSFIATYAIFSLFIASFFVFGDLRELFGTVSSFVKLFSFAGALIILGYAFAALVGSVLTWFVLFGLVTSCQNRFGDEPL